MDGTIENEGVRERPAPCDARMQSFGTNAPTQQQSRFPNLVWFGKGHLLTWEDLHFIRANRDHLDANPELLEAVLFDAVRTAAHEDAGLNKRISALKLVVDLWAIPAQDQLLEELIQNPPNGRKERDEWIRNLTDVGFGELQVAQYLGCSRSTVSRTKRRKTEACRK